ncbi:MAG: hypothetical protein DME85_12075 [Verrucomicrobia bacterium]|nr:MAG: hypothetical protein DME85_12075 [Verrucomicrobiota bacterium]
MLAKASRLSKLFLGGMNSDKSVVARRNDQHARRVCSPIQNAQSFFDGAIRRFHSLILVFFQKSV